jgi:hypothetical protein
MPQLQQSEFDEWLQHPVTKLVRAKLLEELEEIKDQWMSGSFVAETEFGTRFLDAQAIGSARAVQGFLDLTVEDINGEENVDAAK